MEDSPQQTHGKQISRYDMRTNHKESNIIVSQMKATINDGPVCISDDMDVFTLLCH